MRPVQVLVYYSMYVRIVSVGCQLKACKGFPNRLGF
jgi:hypothetical protein